MARRDLRRLISVIRETGATLRTLCIDARDTRTYPEIYQLLPRCRTLNELRVRSGLPAALFENLTEAKAFYSDGEDFRTVFLYGPTAFEPRKTLAQCTYHTQEGADPALLHTLRLGLNPVEAVARRQNRKRLRRLGKGRVHLVVDRDHWGETVRVAERAVLYFPRVWVEGRRVEARARIMSPNSVSMHYSDGKTVLLMPGLVRVYLKSTPEELPAFLRGAVQDFSATVVLGTRTEKNVRSSEELLRRHTRALEEDAEFAPVLAKIYAASKEEFWEEDLSVHELLCDHVF